MGNHCSKTANIRGFDSANNSHEANPVSSSRFCSILYTWAGKSRIRRTPQGTTLRNRDCQLETRTRWVLRLNVELTNTVAYAVRTRLLRQRCLFMRSGWSVTSSIDTPDICCFERWLHITPKFKLNSYFTLLFAVFLEWWLNTYLSSNCSIPQPQLFIIVSLILSVYLHGKYREQYNSAGR